MMRNSATRSSRRDIERQKAGWRDAVPVAVAGVAAIAGLALSEPGNPSDVVLWAVPMAVFVGLLVRAERRDLRRADEYQRILLLEALAVGFVAVLALLFAGGILLAAGVGGPAQWMQVSFVGGVLTWVTTRTVKTRQA